MKDAFVVDSNDIKKILSEHFGVPEGNVVKSQYSYTIIKSEVTTDEQNVLASDCDKSN